MSRDPYWRWGNSLYKNGQKVGFYATDEEVFTGMSWRLGPIGSRRLGPKSLSRYAPTRAARQRIARARQRALIRAGQRQLGVTIYKRHGELKGVDQDLTTSDVLATTNDNSGIYVMNLIRAGNGSYNRIGNKVTLHSLKLNIMLEYTSSKQATTSNVDGGAFRYVLVWDRQPSSGSIPTFDTMFGTTTQDGTESTFGVLDNLRYDNTGRFRVLRDKVVVMNPTNLSYTDGTTNEMNYKRFLKDYIKLPNLKTIFSGESTPMTIADISTGALYLVFRATVNTAGDSEFQVLSPSSARLRYYDA